MLPGPAYNWLCVLHSTAEILSHAARHRASQIVPRSTSSPLNSRKRRRTEDTPIPSTQISEEPIVYTKPTPIEEKVVVPPSVSRNLQSSKVPSSRIGRFFHYGGLAASLGYGAASEILRRTGSRSQD